MIEKISAGLAAVAILLTAALWVNDRFAKASDLVEIQVRVDKNTDANLRVRQQMLNNTRTDREERGLKPDPPWVRQQQRQLDHERCLHRQRFDKKERCDK